MKKTWLRFSPLFVMPVILGINMFLSIGDYAVPLGVGLNEDERMVERYGWRGNVLDEFPIQSITSKEEVEILILESDFKRTFAAAVLIFLVLVYSIVLEWLSRVWKVSLEGIIKIPEKWKPVMIGIVISLYAFAAFRIGAHYVRLVQESEALLHNLVP
ncbi:hypothetical protein ACJA3J_07400 [Halobacillus sp. SY10]|uniref:Uncharacterized protein n=1 Tax=Halobacillus trueperi TaxID=156205 RepID=A0A3D8VPF3_9BACI|nr:hypothetical protein [Halobacillus trueperi]RDY71137.1 hypothetical protein DXT76_09225 [Halobacillus trueperi]